MMFNFGEKLQIKRPSVYMKKNTCSYL